LEGAVSIFIPKDRSCYYVAFRLRLPDRVRQVFRSTGCKAYSEAMKRAAAIFAEEAGKEQEQKQTSALEQLVAEVARLRDQIAKGTSGAIAPSIAPQGTLEQGNSFSGAFPVGKLVLEAIEEFLIDKQPEVSFHQYITLKQRGRRFARYCEAHGAQFVQKITTEHCIDWLDSTKVTRARNNYLGDIGNFLNWCTKHPRKWLPLNPAETVARKRKRYGKPVILAALHADRIMYEVEQNFTRYACFYAIAMLAGVRQDKQDGELKRLAKAVQAQGWAPFIRGDLLRIPKPKVGPERDFPLPENLKEWIRTYKVLEVPSAYMHRKLIKKLKIPDNSMRHTGRKRPSDR
jgi:hypothetical protein